MCEEGREWERVGFLMTVTKNSNNESFLQAYDLQSMRVNPFSCCKTLRQVMVFALITDEDAEGQGS